MSARKVTSWECEECGHAWETAERANDCAATDKRQAEREALSNRLDGVDWMLSNADLLQVVELFERLRDAKR